MAELVKRDCAYMDDENGDKVLVYPGDKIILPKRKFGDVPINDEEKYQIEWKLKHMINLLDGEGPYEISWIGQWACGRIMFYLKIARGEPGVWPRDFIFHSRKNEIN